MKNKFYILIHATALKNHQNGSIHFAYLLFLMLLLLIAFQIIAKSATLRKEMIEKQKLFYCHQTLLNKRKQYLKQMSQLNELIRIMSFIEKGSLITSPTGVATKAVAMKIRIFSELTQQMMTHKFMTLPFQSEFLSTPKCHLLNFSSLTPYEMDPFYFLKRDFFTRMANKKLPKRTTALPGNLMVGMKQKIKYEIKSIESEKLFSSYEYFPNLITEMF